ncbi:hypothetical protein P7C70_g1848, partial [Phenoliferia sp. Uapishka_3]
MFNPRQAETLSACPDTRFFLGGYSKGAMLVHHSASKFSEAQKQAVLGIAVFGDPDASPKGVGAFQGLSNSWPMENPVHVSVGLTTLGTMATPGANVFSACQPGDQFCDDGGIQGLPAHLSYPTNGDVILAVTFLAGLVPT